MYVLSLWHGRGNYIVVVRRQRVSGQGCARVVEHRVSLCKQQVDNDNNGRRAFPTLRKKENIITRTKYYACLYESHAS